MKENKRIELKVLLERYQSSKANDFQDFFDVEEFIQLIDYFLNSEDVEETGCVIDLSLNQHPDEFELLFRRAKYLFASKKSSEALEMLDFLELINPKNYELHQLKGAIYTFNEKLHMALKSFNNSAKYARNRVSEVMFKNAIILSSAGYFHQSIKMLLNAFDVNPAQDFIILELAKNYAHNGEVANSAKFLRLYLNVNPFDEEAWWLLGTQEDKTGNNEKAIEAFEYALALNPDMELALLAKAETYRKMGMYRQAIYVYFEYRLKFPEDIRVYEYIARCYEEWGDFKNALRNFEKIIELDSTRNEAWFKIGMIKFGQEKYLESILAIKKAITICPNNADYWYRLGLACLEIKFFVDAESALERAVKLDPADAGIWSEYARLYFDQKNYDQALDILEQVDKLQLIDARLEFRKAACYVEMQDNDKALMHINDALRLNQSEVIHFVEYCPKAQKFDEINSVLTKFK
jgi:tetratricopeptide (TPR) repeat protein